MGLIQTGVVLASRLLALPSAFLLLLESATGVIPYSDSHYLELYFSRGTALLVFVVLEVFASVGVSLYYYSTATGYVVQIRTYQMRVLQDYYTEVYGITFNRRLYSALRAALRDQVWLKPGVPSPEISPRILWYAEGVLGTGPISA